MDADDIAKLDAELRQPGTVSFQVRDSGEQLWLYLGERSYLCGHTIGRGVLRASAESDHHNTVVRIASDPSTFSATGPTAHLTSTSPRAPVDHANAARALRLVLQARVHRAFGSIC